MTTSCNILKSLSITPYTRSGIPWLQSQVLKRLETWESRLVLQAGVRFIATTLESGHREIPSALFCQKPVSTTCPFGPDSSLFPVTPFSTRIQLLSPLHLVNASLHTGSAPTSSAFTGWNQLPSQPFVKPCTTTYLADRDICLLPHPCSTAFLPKNKGYTRTKDFFKRCNVILISFLELAEF